MGKQIVIDIAVVVITPIVLLGAYFVFHTEDPNDLLSDAPGGAVIKPGEEAGAPGGKARQALAVLRTLSIDVKFFDDPIFVSLQDFPVDVPTVPIGREYPFSMPRDLELRGALMKPKSDEASLSSKLSGSTGGSGDVTVTLKKK